MSNRLHPPVHPKKVATKKITKAANPKKAHPENTATKTTKKQVQPGKTVRPEKTIEIIKGALPKSDTKVDADRVTRSRRLT